jgi:predicted DNA-binding transcriptional regulator AlpA
MKLSYPPPFQDIATLAAHICLGETTIERMVKEGRFPPPRREKCGKRLWVWAEVEKFLGAPEDDGQISEGDRIYEATRRAIRA